MYKKVADKLFLTIFFLVLIVPLVFIKRSGAEVSGAENRMLADYAHITVDGKINPDFTSQFEAWFLDHMGFRGKMMDMNAAVHYYLFHEFLNSTHYYLGADGNLNYADDEMLRDFQRVNLKSEEKTAAIGDSLQYISDRVEKWGASFYYVQCYDKHTIYKEVFPRGANQLEEKSKTDLLIEYLQKNTHVKAISLKNCLLEAKKENQVFSRWGDPLHWNERGAYIAYRYMMNEINQKESPASYRILEETDYLISDQDAGAVINDILHEEDVQETIRVKDPSAVRLENRDDLGKYKDNWRNSHWVNEKADNDTVILVMGDSYFNSYIIDDMAESFSELWMIHADNLSEMDSILKMTEPDIVVLECAERVDRTEMMCGLAERLKSEENAYGEDQ